MHYKNNDYNCGSYIAGLFEGDGHVAIKDKRLKNPKPTFHITFNQKDLPLAEALHDWLRFRAGCAVGSVYVHKKNNSCVLNIFSVSCLITVVHLIRDHLKTPKAYVINTMINWLNTQHDAKLTRIVLCAKPMKASGWLAGFTDADGCFSIDLRRKPRFKLCCQWQLNQRAIDPATSLSYGPCLNGLVKFLGGRKLYHIKPKKGNAFYAIKLSSAKSKRILRDYYCTWPLLSSKRQDFKTWCNVDDMIIKGNARSKVNMIEQLQAHMNLKRKTFDWSHLN